MSKGPGHIQRSILALIERDPDHGDGAWTLGQICEQSYRGINRVEKRHRAAVARALRKMTLRESWEVKRMHGHGEEYCLYNTCSLISAALLDWCAECKRCDRFGWRHPDDDIVEFMRQRPRCYEPSDDHYNMPGCSVPSGGVMVRRLISVEIQIEDIERSASILGEEWVAEKIAKLPELRARLVELKATAKARLSVFEASRAHAGKHLARGAGLKL